MLWLPNPAAVAGTDPIAVADQSAVALERLLLDNGQTEPLMTAMIADPAFCRWVNAWSHHSHSSLRQLADWFAPEVRSFLEPRVDFRALEPIVTNTWLRLSEEQARPLAGVAAAVIERALHAAEQAGQSDALDQSQAYYAAMLSGDQASTAAPSEEYLKVHEGIEWRLPRLAEAVTTLYALEGDFESILEQAKLDAMKELAYGASHEVNNPLANISGRAQAMLRDEQDPKKQRLLKAMQSQAMRAHEMISDLMLFARPPALEKQSTDLVLLAEQVAGELRAAAAERQIVLELAASNQPAVANVDPTQVAVAIQALVQNGIDAVGNDGRVTISVVADDAGASEPAVVLRVVDTGPGITDEVRTHMFEPFYSGREAGRGLGFGLSKCWRIAKEHGGSVEVAETGSAGTAIVLRLPRHVGEH